MNRTTKRSRLTMLSRTLLNAGLAALVLQLLLVVSVQAQTQGFTFYRDLEYARANDISVKLDLLVPNASGTYPLVVYIHGGYWLSGDKSNNSAAYLVNRGYVVASINYRFITQARHPAQISDCKAAIRWLRANAARYKINPNRVAVWGESAGGHLAAALGTTGGVTQLEDLSVGNPNYSSSVQAVVDFFGPSDFPSFEAQAIAACGSRYDLESGRAIAQLMFGCADYTETCLEKLRQGSPAYWVTSDDSPVLLIHGTDDCVVPHAQSALLHGRLKAAGVETKLHTINGGGHGGAQFRAPEVVAMIDAFLDRHLKTDPALSVSAASYRRGALAAEAIVTAFGYNLATGTMAAPSLPLPTTLAGTNVKVRDGVGAERPAPLFFVSPTQVNYQMPAGTAPGQAIITITNANGATSAGAVEITPVAPGLFTADASGQGVAAAVVLRIKPDGNRSFEPVSRFDAAQNKVIAVPIDFGPGEDQLFLLLFGTGFRLRSALSAVTVRIGGESLEAQYAGASGILAGLDQINLRLPQTLNGRGEVDLALTVDGQTANLVKISFK